MDELSTAVPRRQMLKGTFLAMGAGLATGLAIQSERVPASAADAMLHQLAADMADNHRWTVAAVSTSGAIDADEVIRLDAAFESIQEQAAALQATTMAGVLAKARIMAVPMVADFQTEIGVSLVQDLLRLA